MFECYFLKTNIANSKHCKKMHNNLRTELIQQQSHRLRVSLVASKKSIPWLRKTNLKN